MTDYIHWNDRSNPDCLWPLPPEDAATRVSPVESALWKRALYTSRLNESWIICRGLFIFAWPSREGTYGAASGAPQYAERRRDGGHGKYTSLERLLEHPCLQREAPKPANYIGEGWA